MIIDIHNHRGPMPNMLIMDHSLPRILDTMDRLGIQVSFGCNSLCLTHEDFKNGAKQACEDYILSSGRLRAFFFYHPKKADESLKVMRDYLKEPAFCGIKIHPATSKTYADDESYRPVWEFAAQNALPIQAHTWDVSSYNPIQKYSFPSHFEKYVKAYPTVPLFMAHCGGRYNGIVEAARLGREYPNIFYDIAGDIYANGFLEYLVSQVGASRIFYGSDCPMMDQREMLGVVYGADISIEDKERILFKNANEFFGLKL